MLSYYSTRLLGCFVTYTQKLKSFEALPWDDGDELQFTEEADFRRRQAGRYG